MQKQRPRIHYSFLHFTFSILHFPLFLVLKRATEMHTGMDATLGVGEEVYEFLHLRRLRRNAADGGHGLLRGAGIGPAAEQVGLGFDHGTQLGQARAEEG